MKLLRYIFLLFFLFIVSFSNGNNKDDWGKNGHRTTAKIAEGYLKKRAKRKIGKLLDGKSLALVSTFGDDIKSDPAYRKYSSWHYVNIPPEKTYEEIKDELGENLIWAIQKCVLKLKDENTPKNEQQFFLKMLVHLVGDLHQPLHVGHAEDKGGNDINVKWFNKRTNLHRVWDSDMIEFFEMSYSDLARNQEELSRREVKTIQEGNVRDWAMDSKNLVEKVYASTKKDEKLYYRYMYDWFDVVRTQLQKGGIRLAKLLNEIYT